MPKRTLTTGSSSITQDLIDIIDQWEGYGAGHPTGTVTYAAAATTIDLEDRYDTEEMMLKLARDKIWWDPINHDETIFLEVEYNGYDGVWCDGWRQDVTYNVVVDNTVPTVDLIIPNSFGNRNAGSVVQGSIKFPTDLIVYDANEGPNVGATPNCCALVVNKDSWNVKKLNALCHDGTDGGVVWGYNASSTGAHTGSGLTGGCIDKFDIARGYIDHALALNVNQPLLSELDGGYVAPAKNADSGYNTVGNAKRYTGTNEWMKMGSRLAIPDDVATTPEQLGITTWQGKMAFWACKKYGCYIVDTSGWHKTYWSVDYQVTDQFTGSAVEQDMMKVCLALRIAISTDQ